LGSPAYRQKGGELSAWLTSRVNWPLCKHTISKVFPFCSSGYIFPLLIYGFHFYIKETFQSSICFLPLVNSWAQVKSQCSTAKADFRHLLQVCRNLPSVYFFIYTWITKILNWCTRKYLTKKEPNNGGTGG
jgi:hypothetical protein